MRLLPPRTSRGTWWLAAAAALALLPVAGVFTTSRVFFVRDLAWYFWPRHRWMRETIAAGQWPWWDPYIGGGQSAVADALNQFFLLPVTVLRLLAPELIGFNLWVALPFPLAAVGAWLWLRRSVSAPAAFVGALVFALSGPFLSTGNFPNLSWSAACIPWVLWAGLRVEAVPRWGPIAILASIVALQGLSGEAVTFVATGGLVVLHALASPLDAPLWRERLIRSIRVAAGVALGLLLAAVQLVPLWAAAAESPRSQRLAEAMWAMHPLALIETIQPFFFGQPLAAAPAEFPWIPLLNSGREPLFYSVYLGLGALCLAAFRTREDPLRAWRWFWWVVLFGSAICALDHYTPLYSLIERVVPVLQSFRYTVKYILFAAVALAALTATGADALASHARGEGRLHSVRVPFAIATIAAVVGLGMTAANVFAADAMFAGYERLASFFAVEDAGEGARWLAGPATWTWARLGVLGLLAAMLTLALAVGGRATWMAVAIWCAFPIADLAAVNAHLNPTAAPDVIAAPVWLPAVAGDTESRVYIGGSSVLTPQRKRIFMDAPERTVVPGERPFIEAHVIVGNQYMMAPAVWHVRHLISQDLADLWPRRYRRMLTETLRRPVDERIRFLTRAGVRYCILPEPPFAGARPIASLEPIFVGFDVYECGPGARRVYVAGDALVEPELDRQLGLLFSAAHDPSRAVIIGGSPPPAAGRPGPPSADPAARIEADGPTEVLVEAEVGANGGYLALLDSYDPDWHVTVDGEPATLLRANAVFRAVRLAPGRHEVRFRYRPVAFKAGLAVSLCTLMGLAGGWVWTRRISRRASLEAQVGV